MAGITVERHERPAGALEEAYAVPTSWVSATFDALRVRDYRVLWIGTVVSFLAFQMSSTAQSVVAFDLTRNNHAVGFVAFGQGISMLALTPFGGAVADRVSKRLLLLVAQATIGATMFAIGMLILTDSITVFFLAMASFITGMMFSFNGPTRTAYIAELVGPERRGNAMALTQVGMNATRIFGPFLVGGLLAWQLVGAAGTYFFMSGLFVFVMATLVQLPPSAGRRQAGSTVVGDIRLGVRHVMENPRLLQIVAAFWLVTMLGFPYFVVMPGFTKGVLHAGTAGFGLLVGVSAIGGLAMSLVVASMADSPRAPLLQALSSLLMGLALICTGLAPTFAIALVTMVFVGAGGSGFQTLNNTLALREASPVYFGRVMSLTMLAWSFNGLVGLPIGYLADAFGERAVISGMGVSVCGVVALMAVWRWRVPGGPAREGAAAYAE